MSVSIDMNPLYLIDYSNFAYKFKSVYTFAKKEVNGVTIDYSILYGFLRALKVSVFNDIVIVLDGVPMHSLSILPEYKGTRMKDDLNNVSVSKLEIVRFLTKLGERLGKRIRVVCSPGQETDEVISSIVHHVTGNLPPRANFISSLNRINIEDDSMLRSLNKDLYLVDYIPNSSIVTIASTDGDFIQLQRFQNVYIDTSSSGRKVSSNTTSKSTSELTPTASILYKAIYGDVSDNIPSLDIPFAKYRVLELLNKVTPDDLFIIYNACVSESSILNLSKELDAVCNYIYKNKKRGFEINWEVAFLKFRSYPYELHYPTYRIEDTISKFKLKI